MVSTPIKLNTVAVSLLLVLCTEWLAWWGMGRFDLSPMTVVGGVRLIQIAILVWLVSSFEGGLNTIGWAVSEWPAGLKKGAVWSMGFGVATAVAMILIYMTGRNPLEMIKSPLPDSTLETLLFFAVGGFIAPVAEELCFRGILYSFFRRWGMLAAITASTAIFVALHAVRGIPFTQIVGGIVFAVAYETSGNLMVPITIHCLANLAIFSLSLV